MDQGLWIMWTALACFGARAVHCRRLERRRWRSGESFCSWIEAQDGENERPPVCETEGLGFV